jgi:hypothetical protein
LKVGGGCRPAADSRDAGPQANDKITVARESRRDIGSQEAYLRIMVHRPVSGM